MQFQVYYQVQYKFYNKVHMKRIYHYSDAVSSVSTGTLAISFLLSYFELDGFCIHLHP